MNIEIDELTSFVEVAEQLHFGRAATRLHISQPALSKRIRSLEAKIGGLVLARDRRGVALTEAGSLLYKESRGILRDLDLTYKAVRGVATGKIGRLRLGVGISTVHSLVPRALLRFHQSHPGIEIEIADRSTPSQVEAVIAGRLDVGFVRLPVVHPQVAVQKVLRESLAIATSKKLSGAVTIPALREQPFIVIDRRVSATYYDHCIRLCDAAGFAPRIVYEASDMFTLLNLVSAGIGVSLVPSAARAMHVAGVRFSPVRSRQAEWDIGIIWNKRLESQIIREFAEICLSVR